jgi:hypothetical protein
MRLEEWTPELSGTDPDERLLPSPKRNDLLPFPLEPKKLPLRVLLLGLC